MKPGAVFIGWQGRSLPLFNVFDPADTLGHDTTEEEAASYRALGMPVPSRINGPHGSTVSDKTLLRLGIEIPTHPSYDAWKVSDVAAGE